MWGAAAMLAFVSLADDAMNHARLSYEAQRTGNLDQAEQEIRKSIELDRGNALFHSALSGLLVQKHQPEAAIAELETALACKPVEATHIQLMVRLEQLELNWGADLAASGKFTGGLSLATKGAAQFPHSAALLQMLGLFQAKARLNRDAVTSYKRALAIDGDSVDSTLGLAIAEADAGMTVDAMRDFERGMKTYPREPRFPQALGNALLASPDVSAANINRAAILFRKALELNPELEESHYQLGQLAMRAADEPGALAQLQSALRLAPSDARVHFALAKLYRSQHRDADAHREMDLFARASQTMRTQ